MTKEDEEAEWEKTRDIDNPLSPWIQVKYSAKLELWNSMLNNFCNNLNKANLWLVCPFSLQPHVTQSNREVLAAQWYESLFFSADQDVGFCTVRE